MHVGWPVRRQTAVFLFVFAITAPVGVGIGIALADVNAGATMVLYALATGFFIYIGASEVRHWPLPSPYCMSAALSKSNSWEWALMAACRLACSCNVCMHALCICMPAGCAAAPASVWTLLRTCVHACGCRVYGQHVLECPGASDCERRCSARSSPIRPARRAASAACSTWPPCWALPWWRCCSSSTTATDALGLSCMHACADLPL